MLELPIEWITYKVRSGMPFGASGWRSTIYNNEILVEKAPSQWSTAGIRNFLRWSSRDLGTPEFLFGCSIVDDFDRVWQERIDLARLVMGSATMPIEVIEQLFVVFYGVKVRTRSMLAGPALR